MSETKKFGFFGRRDDRPDVLPEDTTPTLSYFFKQLWRKKGKLLTLNLMMVCLYLPLVAVILIYLFGRQTTSAASPMYAPLLGVAISGATAGKGTAAVSALLGIYGGQQTSAFPTTGALVVCGILVGVTALTWGWQNVGATYDLRSLVRGDSCFIWSDYFYAIRRNLKQGFFFGLLDVLIIGVLLFDWYYFSFQISSFAVGVMYFLTVAIFIIYIFMRFYIYLMMITFDLPIRKLLKNALIFSMLGIKRNIMALLGIAATLGLNLLLIYPSMAVGFTLPLILPFFYFPALSGFMASYAAYPNIQRYMIDGPEASEGGETETTDPTPPPEDR